MRRRRLSIALGLLMCALPASSNADPVILTSGSLSYGIGGPLELRVNGRSIEAFFGDNENAMPAPSVTADQPIDLSFSFSGTHDVFADVTLAGLVRVGGITYSLQALTFTVTAGSVIVPPSGNHFSTSSPTWFSFDGTATVEGPDGSLRSLNLLGGGRATLTARAFDGGLAWFSSDYQFEEVAATPEPGSLLLFASGAAALVRIRARSRHR